MTVTAVRKDPAALTMTLTAELDATPERVWQLWEDPRQLERWWGPPQWPATFTSHDLRPGGRAAYRMTGPDGSTPGGYWEVLETDPPRSLHVRDGFADEDGTPNTEMEPSEMRVDIAGLDGGRSRMTIESTFASTEAMQKELAMGMEDGLAQAVSQIDAILGTAR